MQDIPRKAFWTNTKQYRQIYVSADINNTKTYSHNQILKKKCRVHDFEENNAAYLIFNKRM